MAWSLLCGSQQGSLGPGPRHSHSAVAYQSCMYLFGGLKGLREQRDFWKWNSTSHMWTSLKNKWVQMSTVSLSLSGVTSGQQLNVVMSVQHACQVVSLKSQRNINNTGIIMNDIARPCSKCKLHPGQNHQPTPTILTGSFSKEFIGPCPHLTGGKGTWSCWNDMNTEAFNTCWTVRDQFSAGCAVLCKQGDMTRLSGCTVELITIAVQ